MSAPDRQRDGGPFTAGAMCPHCHACDVHPMRVPNPAAPRLVQPSDGTVHQVLRFGGGVVREWVDPDIYDRWDERPYDVIRTCTSCGYEWGQR